MDPVEIVDRQIVSYESCDAKAFSTHYAEDAECFTLDSGRSIAKGRDSIESAWADTFANGPLEVEILKRIVHGRFVIDEERVTNQTTGDVREAVAIYETGQKTIRRVWFLRKDEQ